MSSTSTKTKSHHRPECLCSRWWRKLYPRCVITIRPESHFLTHSIASTHNQCRWQRSFPSQQWHCLWLCQIILLHFVCWWWPMGCWCWRESIYHSESVLWPPKPGGLQKELWDNLLIFIMHDVRTPSRLFCCWPTALRSSNETFQLSTHLITQRRKARVYAV